MAELKRQYFYLCDKKAGACKSREKWDECRSEFCKHTTKESHAKNIAPRQYALHIYGDTMQYWEIEENETDIDRGIS